MSLTKTKENDKYGYMNDEGIEIIPFLYDFIRLDDAFAYVKLNNKWGLFDLKGTEILPIIYDDIKVDDQQYEKIILNDNGKWGMIDIKKEVVLSPIYDLISFYDYNLMYVKQNGKFALFSIEGERISPFFYDSLWPFYGNDFAKVQKNEKWGYIDKTGKEVVPFLYDNVSHEFLQDLALVNKEGKYGYVDGIGNEVISCIYDDAWGFYDGRARVVKNGKYGYINRKGKEIVPCVFDDVRYDFYEGLLCVKKDEKWGFIDKQGKEIIPIIYDWADSFKNGLAIVNSGGVPKITKNMTKVVGGKFGSIDTNGLEIIPVKFKNIDCYAIERFYRRNKCFDLTEIIAYYCSPVKKRNTTGKQLFEVVSHLINISKTDYLKIDVEKILPVAIDWSKSSKLTERKLASILIHALCIYSTKNKTPKIHIDTDTQNAFKKVMSNKTILLDDYFEIT